MQEQAKKIALSPTFQNFITVAIIANSLILGIETFDITAGARRMCEVLNGMFLAIYAVEMTIKLYALRASFFKSGWNIFDLVITTLSCIPVHLLSVPPQVARLLRLLRALRALRLISAFRQIRSIIDGLLRALPGVLWTFLLLLIIFYIFAVTGVEVFGDAFPELFGTLAHAFYTLFQIMTLEGWSDGICRPIMEVYSWAWAYFVPFVVISSFVMLNVVVGVIVASIDEVNRHLDDEEENCCERTELTLQDLKAQLDRIEAQLSANALPQGASCLQPARSFLSTRDDEPEDPARDPMAHAMTKKPAKQE